MGLDIGKFFGAVAGSAAGSAEAPAATIADAAEKLVGMFKLPPEVKAQLQAQLAAENVDLEKAQMADALAHAQMQADINKQEAASANWFVAGWRPACGWACVLALFVQFFVAPLGSWIAALLRHPITFPALDMATLLPLLAGMLGLGGLRTIEKIQNASTNH